MRLIRLVGLAVATAALVGCGTAPTLQGARPASAQNQQYGLAKSEVVARTDHMTQHLDDGKSIVYYQNQGGGGAGLGLLLGPLGVAANVKMIESVTTGDVEKLKGHIRLNPEAALQQAAAATSFALQPTSAAGSVNVTPYVLVSKTDETTFNVSSIVLFEGVDGEKKWTRRYQYELPGKYTLDSLAAFTDASSAELQSASVAAYAALLRHIADEKDAAIAQEKKITFTSAYMTPRFEFEMMGSLVGEKEGRVWVRTVFGVIAIAPADIQYQIARD